MSEGSRRERAAVLVLLLYLGGTVAADVAPCSSEQISYGIVFFSLTIKQPRPAYRSAAKTMSQTCGGCLALSLLTGVGHAHLVSS
jgi:hypothetical protein